MPNEMIENIEKAAAVGDTYALLHGIEATVCQRVAKELRALAEGMGAGSPDYSGMIRAVGICERSHRLRKPTYLWVAPVVREMERQAGGGSDDRG